MKKPFLFFYSLLLCLGSITAQSVSTDARDHEAYLMMDLKGVVKSAADELGVLGNIGLAEESTAANAQKTVSLEEQLKAQISNNIYTECLARAASLSGNQAQGVVSMLTLTQRMALLCTAKAFQAFGVGRVDDATAFLPVLEKITRALNTALEKAKEGDAQGTYAAFGEAQRSEKMLECYMKEVAAEGEANYEMADLWSIITRQKGKVPDATIEAVTKAAEELMAAQALEQQETDTQDESSINRIREKVEYWRTIAEKGKNAAMADQEVTQECDEKAQESKDASVAQAWKAAGDRYRDLVKQCQESRQDHQLTQECRQAAEALKLRAMSETKRSSAQVSGNQQLAAAWKKAADDLQQLIQFNDQLVKARQDADHNKIQQLSTRKSTWMQQRGNSLESLMRAASYLEKRLQVEDQGNEELARCYGEIVEVSKQLGCGGHRQNAEDLQKVNCFMKQAEYLEKAQKAQAAGYQELAGALRIVAGYHKTISQFSYQQAEELQRAQEWETAAQNELTRLQRFMITQPTEHAHKNLQDAQAKVRQLSEIPNAVHAAREGLNRYTPIIERLEKQAVYRDAASSRDVTQNNVLKEGWNELIALEKSTYPKKETAAQLGEAYRKQCADPGQDQQRVKRNLKACDEMNTSSQRVLTQVIPGLKTALERLQEAVVTGNKGLIEESENIVQGWRKAGQEEEKLLQLAAQAASSHTIALSEAAAQAPRTALQHAQTAVNKAQTAWKAWHQQKRMKETLGTPIERALSPWNDAICSIEAVLEKRSEVTAARNAKEHQKLNTLLGEARKLEKAATAEIERVQGRMMENFHQT